MLPRKFYFEAGAFTSGTTILEWNGENLCLFEQETPRIPNFVDDYMSIIPSDEMWQNFENGLEAIGAFSWDDEYSDDSILDGMCIEIWITFRRRVKCRCYNAVPPNFNLFLDLLNALTKANPSDEDLITGLL